MVTKAERIARQVASRRANEEWKVEFGELVPVDVFHERLRELENRAELERECLMRLTGAYQEPTGVMQGAANRMPGCNDHTALKRRVGLVPRAKCTKRGKVYEGGLATHVDRETALQVAEALGMDPHEVGL